MIQAFILDDEFGAIKNLQLILQDMAPNIEVIGYATSTKDAELKIRMLKPDVLFLDIEMPNESGIEFLKRLHYYDFEVVFVTAYNEFAIQAFKLNAIDYLLKPIDQQEMKHCLERINDLYVLKSNYRMTLTKEKLEHFCDSFEGNDHSKIVLKNKDAIEFVSFEHIIYLRGDGSYTDFTFELKGKITKILMSYPLSHYESILPKKTFLRVHKSFIINTKFIKQIQKSPGYTILLHSGETIPISKRRVADIITQLQK